MTLYRRWLGHEIVQTLTRVVHTIVRLSCWLTYQWLFVMLTNLSMTVTCQCLMPIPKSALGQEVPTYTTFENANHLWTYENNAYHFWQKPIIKSYNFSHTSTKTHFVPIPVSQYERHSPYWYRTITWSKCFNATIASSSWWFQLDSQRNFYYEIVHVFSHDHINQNAVFFNSVFTVWKIRSTLFQIRP